MSTIRSFPIVKKADRNVIKALAAKLLETEGFKVEAEAFDWLDWSDSQVRIDGHTINARTVWVVAQALQLLPVFREIELSKAGGIA
jgi:hypothetical protein